MARKTFSDALGEALQETMRRDKNIFVMGEDIEFGLYNVTRNLMGEFGRDRVRNTPISESAMAGIAVGAACAGMRPVLEIMFADIMAISSDHIINSMAKIHYLSDGMVKVPMTLRTTVGFGMNQGAMHSQCCESWFANVPGLIIVEPSNPYDAKGLLISSIESDDPVLFLEHKRLTGTKSEVPDGYYTLPIGKGVIRKEGTDLTLVSYGVMMRYAEAAAARLEEEDISVELVDPRTLRPLDIELILDSVKKTGRLMVVQEAPTFGGFGGEIVAEVAEKALHDLKQPVVRIGGDEVPVPFAMESSVLPNEQKIYEGIKKMLGKE